MTINIDDAIIERLGNVPELMEESIEQYVKRAILTQLQIDNVVLEDDIPISKEFHTIPVLARSSMHLKKVLEDKGFDAEIIVDENDRKKQYIKTNMEPEYFPYIESIKENHRMTLRLPAPIKCVSGRKLEQLERMYCATAFSCPRWQQSDSEDD